MSEFTTRELALESGELLPAREALALFNFAAVYATNSATALNVITSNSLAEAGAFQLIAVSQS